MHHAPAKQVCGSSRALTDMPLRFCSKRAAWVRITPKKKPWKASQSGIFLLNWISEKVIFFFQFYHCFNCRCEVTVLATGTAGWVTSSCQERYALFSLTRCATGATGWRNLFELVWQAGEGQPEDVAEPPCKTHMFFKQVLFHVWMCQSCLQYFCAVLSCSLFGRETPTTWSELVAEQLGMVPGECRTPSPGTLLLTSWCPLFFAVYVPFQLTVMHVIADQTETAISSMEK